MAKDLGAAVSVTNRVAFITFNFQKGIGGHYLSMLQTARSNIFSKSLIIDVGYQPTALFDDERDVYIKYSITKSFSAFSQLKKFLIEKDVKLVMCYDNHSYTLASPVCRLLGLKIVYVKCGGPRPKIYFPRAEYIITYSKEDMTFFSEKLPGSELVLIPNQVSEAKLLEQQVNLGESFGRSSVSIVCIARLDQFYLGKINLAVAMVEDLRNKYQQDASLFIIGSVQQQEVYAYLKALQKPYLTILTSENFTRDAAKFLNNFDASVSTGRGAVESALLGLKTYIPVNGSQDLALLSAENYDLLKATNFSGRAKVDRQIARHSKVNQLSASEVTVLTETIRNDYTVERSGTQFENFLQKIKPHTRMKIVNWMAGVGYFTYCGIWERNYFFRKNIYPAIAKVLKL